MRETMSSARRYCTACGKAVEGSDAEHLEKVHLFGPTSGTRVEEVSAARPTSSNADDWQLWLQEYADSGDAYKAVQIGEAIEEHVRGLASEVYKLAEDTVRFSDVAMEDTPEGHYYRGRTDEAKSIARAINAIMPYKPVASETATRAAMTNAIRLIKADCPGAAMDVLRSAVIATRPASPPPEIVAERAPGASSEAPAARPRDGAVA